MNNPHDAIGEMLKDLGAIRNTSGPATKPPHYWKRFPTVLGQPRFVNVYLESASIKVEMDDSGGGRHSTQIHYEDPDLIDRLEWLFEYGDLDFYAAEEVQKMNHREICELDTDFQTAFSFELADVLDQHITGFNFQWNRGDGCFIIREAKRPGASHSRIAMDIYISKTARLFITHYSFPRSKGAAQKCQNSKDYDLADPQFTPESIGKEIADMLDATLPYHRVKDVEWLTEAED